jgi:REP element-mobilizing transposase RayT
MARPRRIPGYPYTGVQRYFLTFCTKDRATHFTTHAIVDPIVDRILQAAADEEIAVIVYLMMPDHVHMLVDGESDESDLESFMKLAKQKTGYWFKQGRGRRLWQEGYYEHVLRDDERTEDVIGYILENPLRKNLVVDVMHYPFWGSSLYTREELLRSIGLKQRRS